MREAPSQAGRWNRCGAPRVRLRTGDKWGLCPDAYPHIRRYTVALFNLSLESKLRLGGSFPTPVYARSCIVPSCY